MEYQVQKAGLKGEWKTVCRNANETYARAVYEKQLQLYSIGNFRLVAPNGDILEEKKANTIFGGKS